MVESSLPMWWSLGPGRRAAGGSQWSWHRDGHLLTAGPAAAPLLPWLARVADDLAARVPALAADLLTQVLDTPAALADQVSGQLQSALAVSLLRSGRPSDAEQVARSALVAAHDPRTRAALWWTLASAYAGRGATDRAMEEIGAALAAGELTLGEQARFSGLRARCYITLSQPDEARAAWEESIAAARTSGDTEALAFATAAAAGTRSWDGWIEDALTFCDSSVAATRSLGSRAGAQLAPHLNRGICLAELDRDVEADQAFEDALRMAERGIGTDYLAWGYQCLARQRFWQGRRAEAALRQAVAGYESLDAGWDVARTDSALRTLGVRRGKKGPRRCPRSGWEAMTETELIVAGLVAEGLSNPQIGVRMYLSRRTVQYHVSSILTKLDIVSRVELAALVVRRGGVAG
jgi:DNA-binding CsgD family transcriptional regulator